MDEHFIRCTSCGWAGLVRPTAIALIFNVFEGECPSCGIRHNAAYLWSDWEEGIRQDVARYMVIHPTRLNVHLDEFGVAFRIKFSFTRAMRGGCTEKRNYEKDIEMSLLLSTRPRISISIRAVLMGCARDMRAVIQKDIWDGFAEPD